MRCLLVSRVTMLMLSGIASMLVFVCVRMLVGMAMLEIPMIVLVLMLVSVFVFVLHMPPFRSITYLVD